MNGQMQSIMGTGGEQLAYRFMGERLAACATGNGPVAFGTMMGMMGTLEMGASYGSAYPAGAYGSMMGGYRSNQTAGNGGTSVGVIVAIVLGALLLLARIVLLATRGTPRRPTHPRPNARRPSPRPTPMSGIWIPEPQTSEARSNGGGQR